MTHREKENPEEEIVVTEGVRRTTGVTTIGKHGMSQEVSALCSRFFDYLNNKDIFYCVTHRYEELPDFMPSDIDIAIDSSGFHDMDKLLDEFCYINKVKLIQKIWHGYHQKAYMLSPLSIKAIYRFQLDFFIDFSPKGYLNLIPNEILLNNRRRYKNFYITSPASEMLVILIKRITKNDLTVRHIEKLQQLYSLASSEILERIKSILGLKLAPLVIRMVKLKDISVFEKHVEELQRSLRRHSKVNTSIKERIGRFVYETARVIHRLKHPVGFSIAISSIVRPPGQEPIRNSIIERVSGSFNGTYTANFETRGRYERLSVSNTMRPDENHDDFALEITGKKRNQMKQSFGIMSLMRYVLFFWKKIYINKVKKCIVLVSWIPPYDRIVLSEQTTGAQYFLGRALRLLLPLPDLLILIGCSNHDRQSAGAHKLSDKNLLNMEHKMRRAGFHEKICFIPDSRSDPDIINKASYHILLSKSRQTRMILQLPRTSTPNRDS